MTPKMREALAMLQEHGESDYDETAKWGVVTTDATHLSSGQPWINWRTAEALERAGVAQVRGYGEECEVWIP